MLLWIILTLMTSIAAVWLATPLLRRIDERRVAGASALEVYRDQLTEVARERADGVIDAELAAAADVEIKRRMLSAERMQAAKSSVLSLGERHIAVVSVVGIIVLGSTILYSNSGRPDLPSVSREPTSLVLGDRIQGSSFQPNAGRPRTEQAANTRPVQPPQQVATAPGAAPAVASGPTSVPAAAQPGDAGAALGSVDDMIQRLVDRLAKDPGNAETLRMLGWSYFSTDRYAEAADAYRKAVDVQPKNAALLASYGEALVRAADGQVKPDAIAIFDRVLTLDAKEPRARFFKGLVQEQAGDKRAALDSWVAILADVGAGEAWAPELWERVMLLAGELGIDVTAKLPAAADASPAESPAKQPTSGGILQTLKDRGAAPDVAAAPAPAPRGPTSDDVKAAEKMAPTDRTAMIRGMVDGLASRLETSPRDADGWIQLIRSRKVLGEADAAKAALVKALTIFNDVPAEQQRIVAAALKLGVSP